MHKTLIFIMILLLTVLVGGSIIAFKYNPRLINLLATKYDIKEVGDVKIVGNYSRGKSYFYFIIPEDRYQKLTFSLKRFQKQDPSKIISSLQNKSPTDIPLISVGEDKQIYGWVLTPEGVFDGILKVSFDDQKSIDIGLSCFYQEPGHEEVTDGGAGNYRCSLANYKIVDKLFRYNIAGSHTLTSKKDGTPQEEENLGLQDSRYTVCNKQVYFLECKPENLVVGADADTFKSMEPSEGRPRYYYTDKNYVYFGFGGRETEYINNSDGPSFELLDQCYAKDRNQIYFDIWTEGGIILRIRNSVDVATFEPVYCPVARDKNNVYYSDWDGIRIIKDADARTTVSLGSPFFKDKSSIFFGEDKIIGADSSTFTPLGSEFGYSKYAKDKNYAYYCGGSDMKEPCKKMTDVDLGTLQMVVKDNYMYANGDVVMDKNRIYSQGVSLENSDPATFEVNFDNTAYDKNNKYLVECYHGGNCLLYIVPQK